MSKIISPCVGICKYKLQGHCSGCGMKKGQKKAFKKIKTSTERRAFLLALISCQKELDVHDNWARSYHRKCAKRGKQLPLKLKI